MNSEQELKKQIKDVEIKKQKDNQQQQNLLQQNLKKPKKRILKVIHGQINSKNINILRKLNFQTFPVKYSTALYMKIMTQYTEFSKLSYYNDIVIGAYTVRIQPYKNQPYAYILTFGVLQPYRKYGVGRQMMEYLEQDLLTKSNVKGVYLHMHVINIIGKKFYQSCGFIVDQRLENYYTDLQEPHCYILLKNLQRK